MRHHSILKLNHSLTDRVFISNIAFDSLLTALNPGRQSLCDVIGLLQCPVSLSAQLGGTCLSTWFSIG